MQALIRFDLRNEMANCHFILWVIAEDTDVDLIANAFAFQKVFILHELADFVQTFFNGTHLSASLSLKTVKRRKHRFIAIQPDCFL